MSLSVNLNKFDILETLEFYRETNKLKKTLRYGDHDPVFFESAADHTWKMVLMAIDLHRKLELNVDLLKTIKIITFHDLPEYVLNQDIDANDVKTGKISGEEKHLIEDKTIKDLCEKYNLLYVYDLWCEFEYQKTREAKLAKAIDKMETTLHIIFQNGGIVNHDLTLTYCDKSVVAFPELIPFLEKIKAMYKDFYALKGYEWDSKWETSHLVTENKN